MFFVFKDHVIYTYFIYWFFQRVTDADLVALVSDEVFQPEVVWKLLDLQVTRNFQTQLQECGIGCTAWTFFDTRWGQISLACYFGLQYCIKHYCSYWFDI